MKSGWFTKTWKARDLDVSEVNNRNNDRDDMYFFSIFELIRSGEVNDWFKKAWFLILRTNMIMTDAFVYNFCMWFTNKRNKNVPYF